jgi:uncharacterized membrane protein
MYKIIGADQKEYGPVSADLIRQWIKEGRANAQTMAKFEGTDAWLPLSELPEFAVDFGGPAPTFPPLVPPEPTPESAFTSNAPLDDDYTIDAPECIGRGWRLFQANVGLFVGTTVLLFLISFGCGLIPVLGALANLVISGPLYGGIYMLMLKRIRGQDATYSDLFEGFSKAFLPLMLGQIVVGVLTFLSAFLFVVAVGAIMILHRPMFLPFGILLAVIGIIPAVYLATCWLYSLPLIIDRGMDFWSAMELSRKTVARHWGQVFILLILSGLISIAGLLLCGVGMLATFPICIAALMYGYEEIFNRGTIKEP